MALMCNFSNKEHQGNCFKNGDRDLAKSPRSDPMAFIPLKREASRNRRGNNG